MLTTGRGKIGDWPVKIDAGNTYSFHTQIKIQGRKVRAAEPRNLCLKFRSSAWERAGWVRATEHGKKIWEPSSCVAQSLNGNEKTDRRKDKTSRKIGLGDRDFGLRGISPGGAVAGEERSPNPSAAETESGRASSHK
jgi:hypothetical protein